MWQNIAFALIGIGILVLLGWAVKDFFTASEIPLILRIAVGAISVGILFLIGIAIKDRIAKAKKENFKEIEK
ncbi:MAG: hypothetical protein JSW30_05620 [Dehalococcoidia bacterium]|nr:MAG: hypothetical protein JSW30_05620 [Dehalococcoidia bacterium]